MAQYCEPVDEQNLVLGSEASHLAASWAEREERWMDREEGVKDKVYACKGTPRLLLANEAMIPLVRLTPSLPIYQNTIQEPSHVRRMLSAREKTRVL